MTELFRYFFYTPLLCESLFGELELVFLFDPITFQVAMFSEISKSFAWCGGSKMLLCFKLVILILLDKLKPYCPSSAIKAFLLLYLRSRSCEGHQRVFSSDLRRQCGSGLHSWSRYERGNFSKILSGKKNDVYFEHKKTEKCCFIAGCGATNKELWSDAFSTASWTTCTKDCPRVPGIVLTLSEYWDECERSFLLL